MRKYLIAWLAVALLVTGSTPAAGWARTAPHVVPSAETPALFDDESGGNADADDPAIWIDEDHPGRSIVVGTAKNGGLDAYRLTGQRIQHVATPPAPGPAHEPGRFNNVDVLQDVEIGGDDRDLAIVSDRGRDQLRFYEIDDDAVARGRPLTDVTARSAPLVFSRDQAEVDEQRTAYGLAAWYDDRRDAAYVLVSQRDATRIALLRLIAERDRIGYRLVRTLDLPSQFPLPGGTSWKPCDEPGVLPQVEGMVVDVDKKVLYAGQEDVGIWRVSARLDGEPALVDRVREFGVPGHYDPETDECVLDADPGFGGKHISADVEGLTVYYGPGGTGYLLASSQGDNTFAIYRRNGANGYVGSFRVAANGRFDGTEESDGAAVLNTGLGSRFPNGILVVQDGLNTPAEQNRDGDARDNTNFKFVRWESVARSLTPPLLIHSSR